MTRYISTRGEAPALGFCDVMLTGLARDGGLYVPEVWPQLSPDVSSLIVITDIMPHLETRHAACIRCRRPQQVIDFLAEYLLGERVVVSD